MAGGGRLRVAVEPGYQHASRGWQELRLREQLLDRNAVPLGGAQQTEMRVARVSGTLEQKAAERLFRGQQLLQGDFDARLDQAIDHELPGRTRVEQVRIPRAYVK